MNETKTVSPLRQRMIEDMAARKLNPHTQRSHIYSCKRFAAWLKRSPDTATPDEVRRAGPLGVRHSARPKIDNQPSCGRPARRVIKRGKAAPRRRASEVASVRGESRHDESRSLARGDFARARRPVSAMLRRGSAVRLSAQTGGVDSRPRPLQLQRRSLAWAAMGVAHSDAEVWLLRLPPASGRRLAAGRRMRVIVVRETEFFGLRLAGYFRRRMRENSRNSVRRPRCASLTRRNYGGFCLPGNRPGLSGLHGGAEGIQTDGHRDLTPSGRGIRQNLSGGRFGHPSVQYDAQHFTFPLAPGSDLSRAKTTQ